MSKSLEGTKSIPRRNPKADYTPPHGSGRRLHWCRTGDSMEWFDGLTDETSHRDQFQPAPSTYVHNKIIVRGSTPRTTSRVFLNKPEEGDTSYATQTLAVHNLAPFQTPPPRQTRLPHPSDSNVCFSW
jgi:hypothetical protein